MEENIKQSKETSFSWRVEKSNVRVLGIKPSMDLENARILTVSFMQTEGVSAVMR